MSAEDLTTQAGVAVQQDLALATLIGATHVERNGHHYVDGMTRRAAGEQDAFLAAHPDLYHRAANGRARDDPRRRDCDWFARYAGTWRSGRCRISAR